MLNIPKHASRVDAPREAGFTLLEMIVVIAIMGLVLGLLASSFPPRSHWLDMQAAARNVAEAMRDARGSAIVQGHPVALTLPPLPAWLAVTLQPASGIVFLPDGSASGGTVLLDGNGRELAVSADWLTGAVTIHGP